MYSVHYCGPKVEISHHGVTFLTNKEDKYIYLAPALEILKDLDNDFTVHASQTYTYTDAPLDEHVLKQVLSSYEPKIENHIEEELTQCKAKIRHEQEFVESLPQLDILERETWLKNITLMQPYRLQRTINKLYYEHIIDAIATKIIQNKIKTLATLPDKRFFHILYSIKNKLTLHKLPFDADIIEKTDANGKLTAILQIKMS
jgi:hypothetical protein